MPPSVQSQSTSAEQRPSRVWHKHRHDYTHKHTRTITDTHTHTHAITDTHTHTLAKNIITRYQTASAFCASSPLQPSGPLAAPTAFAIDDVSFAKVRACMTCMQVCVCACVAHGCARRADALTADAATRRVCSSASQVYIRQTHAFERVHHKHANKAGGPSSRALAWETTNRNYPFTFCPVRIKFNLK